MGYSRLIFRVHAVRRMFDRGITEIDVREVLEDGRIIERNPKDLPYPSYLVLGFPSGRPVHVVASDDLSVKATIVITVYRPDPKRWGKMFHRRKK
jgi:hypothetical protein